MINTSHQWFKGEFLGKPKRFAKSRGTITIHLAMVERWQNRGVARSDTEMARILGELDALRAVSGCRLTLIQCDYEIKTIKSFEAWETTFAIFDRMEFVGRGGTSLKPPFEWVADRVSKGDSLPDAMIYLTDGFGESPTAMPGYPCVWIVPNNGRTDFPFGETIMIDV